MIKQIIYQNNLQGTCLSDIRRTKWLAVVCITMCRIENMYDILDLINNLACYLL